MLSVAVYAIVLAAVVRPDNPNYSYVQTSIFVGELLFVMLFIITRKNHKEMLISAQRAMTSPRAARLEDWTQFLNLLVFVSPLVWLFFADLNGLGGGFRIGSVAAVGISRIITGMVRASKAKNQL